MIWCLNVNWLSYDVKQRNREKRWYDEIFLKINENKINVNDKKGFGDFCQSPGFSRFSNNEARQDWFSIFIPFWIRLVRFNKLCAWNLEQNNTNVETRASNLPNKARRQRHKYSIQRGDWIVWPWRHWKIRQMRLVKRYVGAILFWCLLWVFFSFGESI